MPIKIMKSTAFLTFVVCILGGVAASRGQSLREPGDTPATGNPAADIQAAKIRAAITRPITTMPIKTDGGEISGLITPDGKLASFKGVPYAAPPVGDLRWRAPQPAARLKKVLAANRFGSRCVQSGGYSEMVFHDRGESEDCLTLNLWVPVGAQRGSLPVMVWIHGEGGGGGFATGGTSESRQDGEFLARRGVVVVSMNYRLGILGFMAHPELTAESGHQASGNYGLMDQMAAIAWVKRNVLLFGGDPKNITIFGEAAGSMSVSAQMASPLTKGLFEKAIGESGGAFASGGQVSQTREASERADVEFARTALGMTTLAELRKVPASVLVKAVTANGGTSVAHFRPNVDGYFLPDSVENIYAAGNQAHIPLLAGWNADEMQPGDRPTVESFQKQAGSEFGRSAAKFLAVYPGKTDGEAAQSAKDYAGDRFMGYSTWAWLEAQSKTGGAPVYRYIFELGSPGDKNHRASLGAFHSDDIEYVFGTLDSRPEAVWRPEDRELSSEMGDYWTNFARTGNPNGGELPGWPLYSAEGGWPLMHLNSAIEVTLDDLRGRYLFLDGAWHGGAARSGEEQPRVAARISAGQ